MAKVIPFDPSKKKEKPTKNQLDVARLNLTKAPALQDYVAKGVGDEIAGELMKSYNPFEKAPDQNTWEILYQGPLESKGAVTINSPYLIQGAQQTLQASLLTLTVGEALTYVGGPKELAEKFKGKYLFELEKEEQQAIISFYMQGLVETRLADNVIPIARTERKNLLTKMFAPEEKPKAA